MKPCPVCQKTRTLFVRTDKLRCLRCHEIAVAMTERNTPTSSRAQRGVALT